VESGLELSAHTALSSSPDSTQPQPAHLG